MKGLKSLLVRVPPRRRWHCAVGALCVYFLLLSMPVFAAPDSRIVLGLFDSGEPANRSADYNVIHRNIEMILNYLGMKVRYHDMAAGLPSEQEMTDVYGVVSAFRDEQIAGAEKFCDWASAQISAGRKYVFLGSPGFFADQKTKEKTSAIEIRRFFSLMGIDYQPDVTDNPLLIEVVEKDISMVEFERTLEHEVGYYDGWSARDADSRVYLKLRRTDQPESESDAVLTTSAGGAVMESYALFFNDLNTMRQWRINPFRFFEEAFQLKGKPRFDTTTLFGRRILYSHIDGDGFRNRSEVDGRFSAEVIRDEVLKRFSLPVLVSFIAAEMDPDYLGSEEIIAAARSIARLPNVELGSHTFSHPLDWERQVVSFPVKGYAKEYSLDKLESVESLPLDYSYHRGAIVKASQNFFLKKEVEQSVRYINETLAPQDKKVQVFQWSGNCRPQEAAVAMAQSLGLLTMNGADNQLDRWQNSVTGIAALARPVGRRLQFYNSNANENIYTRGWTPPYDRYRYVAETFHRTDQPGSKDVFPRRLTPINIYYHFFIGDKKAGLRSLQDVHQFARAQPTIPIFASNYLAIVKGFFEGQLEPLEGGWRFSRYGKLRTIRFDGETQWPDLERSLGIMGFFREQNRLYVHLVEEGPAELYWTETAPVKPYLEEASTVPEAWVITPEKVAFETRVFGQAEFRAAGMRPNASYRLRVTEKEGYQTVYDKSYQADSKGNLSWSFPAEGSVRVDVVVYA